MLARKGVHRCLNLSGKFGKRNKTRFAYPPGYVAYEHDYSDTPSYPPIDPELRTMSQPRKDTLNKRLKWQESIRAKPNVEEKTIEMNMIRRYGWYSQVHQEHRFDYGSLPYYKHITRTHLESCDSLPPSYSSPELMEKVAYFKEKIRNPLTEALRFEKDIAMRNSEPDGFDTSEIDPIVSKAVVMQVNRVMLNILGSEVSHLNTCKVDMEPKIDAFWSVGGMEPSLKDLAHRKMLKTNTDRWKAPPLHQPGDPVERNMQYLGSPMLQIRCEDPVANFVPDDSPLISKGEDVTDRFNYEHRIFRVRSQFKFASNIPGYWSGENQNKCSHIGIHPRTHLYSSNKVNNPHWAAEKENLLQSQAVLTSFARLLSQAFFFGFDQWSDVQHPFSTQTIITDGINWSFYAYQLNTIQLDDLRIAKNKKQNICWGTQSMKIFEEGSADKLNDAVVENLLKFYLHPPAPISTVNSEITPYLGRKISEVEDLQERATLFANYRTMVSQKHEQDELRHWQFPEIYDWEWIYKIKNKMRPLDARRKYYELPHKFKGSDPYNMPYMIRDPLFVGKGVRRMKEECEIARETERVAAAKLVERRKYTHVEE